MSIARTLAATLAVAALAVPAAQARPADIHAPVVQAAAKAQQTQDLRSPDAIDAGRSRGHVHPVNAPGATAVDSATRPAPRTFPGPPTWPVNPQPITPAPAVTVADDGGVNWTTIGLGIAGSLLAVGALALVTTRRRRTQQLRVAG